MAPKIEKRVDPDDGASYSYDDMASFYKGKFKKKAIDEYWESCAKAGAKVKVKAKAKAAEPKAKAKAAEPKAKVKAKAKAKVKVAKPRAAIKLTYFKIEGVAEKIRLALAMGKIEYEDERLTFEEWGELKAKGGAKYGQLPLMKIGDAEPIAQSGAMLRHCGRLARLYPPHLTLKIEEVIGLEEDIGRTVMPSLYVGMRPQIYGYAEDMPKEEKTKIQMKLRAAIIEKPEGALFKQLGYLEKFLEDGSPFMCGKSPTIADCQVIPRLRHLKSGILDGIPTTILDDFPKLVEYYNRFLAIPEVKGYQRKRDGISCCPPGAAGYLAADHDDEGKVGETEGVSYYQVGSGEAGLLALPDIWGWNGGRTRAIADDLAKKGLNVWVPKLLKAFEGGTDGDALPPTFNVHERFSDIGPLVKDGGDWNPNVIMPYVLKVVAAMKKSGVQKIGCAGICFGGWIGMRLAAEIDLVCAVSPHPSVHMEGMVGGDPAVLASKSSCPWAFFPCGVVGKEGSDPDIYEENAPFFKALEAKFPGKNVSKRFPDMLHGFVARGNIKKDEFNLGKGRNVKLAVQECVEDMTAFFKKEGLLKACSS